MCNLTGDVEKPSSTICEDSPLRGEQGGVKGQTHIDKSKYDVRAVPLSVAAQLVQKHHYAKHASNTAVYLHGLFLKKYPNICLGVAWWIPPTKAAAIATWDGDWRRVLSLSRLVIVPGLPTNAASHLIGQSIRRIKKDHKWECLVTYADTWRGHTGKIYRATNWEYVGLTSPERVWINRDGQMVSRKAGPSTRTKSEMLNLGCYSPGAFSKHKFRMVLIPGKRNARQDQ